jgi:hypothetical protein
LEFFIKLYVFFYIMLEMDTIIFHDMYALERNYLNATASTLRITSRSRRHD